MCIKDLIYRQAILSDTCTRIYGLAPKRVSRALRDTAERTTMPVHPRRRTMQRRVERQGASPTDHRHTKITGTFTRAQEH